MTKEGIIQKVFKEVQLEHSKQYSAQRGYEIWTLEELESIQQKLIAEIEQVFPLGYSNYSSVYIRHYLLGEKK